MCSHTLTLFWLGKTFVIVEIYQIISCVFVCAFPPEIFSFFVKSFPFFSHLLLYEALVIDYPWTVFFFLMTYFMKLNTKEIQFWNILEYIYSLWTHLLYIHLAWNAMNHISGSGYGTSLVASTVAKFSDEILSISSGGQSISLLLREGTRPFLMQAVTVTSWQVAFCGTQKGIEVKL